MAFRGGEVYQSAFWVLIALLLGLSANGIRIYLSGPEKASITGPARTWQEERIRQGLEIYRLEQGSYPQTLSELSRKGILPESDLKFGQKRQYYYEEGGYQISGPRP